MSEPTAQTYIAPQRVERAFGPGAAAFLAAVDTVEGAHVSVHDHHGSARDLIVREPSSFAAALERPDLTRHDDLPVVLVNLRYELIALAYGPVAQPQHLHVMAFVVALGESGAVEILSSGDAQPAWLLFELEPGTRDAALREGA